MDIRETYFRDYGMSENDVKKVKEWCKKADPDDKLDIIYRSCRKANPALMDYLMYSMVTGAGYDALSRSTYIPIQKGDFYGYQRKAYEEIFRLAKSLGKIKFP